MQDKHDEKNRNYIKPAVNLLVILLVVLAVTALTQGKYIARDGNTDVSSGTEDNPGEYYNSDNNTGPGKESMEDDIENFGTSMPLIKVNTDPSSYTALVNRDYPMPEDYVPEDLVIPDVEYSYNGIYEKSYMRKAAAEAIEKMFAKARKKKNLRFKVVSAYRSYARQKAIYEYNINTRGMEETNLVSAQPGCSEHQTGLAIDVSSDTVNCTIEESFASCKEGKWLARNCKDFGFIIRYPKGKSDVTGYSYEPWHIRYVGVNLARYIYKKGLTLEEYYQTTTIDEEVPEDELIIDKDDNAPKEPEMTAAPTPQTTAYITKTAIPVPEPTEPPVAVPQQTPRPVVTEEPEETEEPARTKEPEKTKRPARTKEPERTKRPVATEKPERTKEPVQTEKPERTEKPVVTQNPEETPEQTKEPEQTNSPAEEETVPPEKEPEPRITEEPQEEPLQEEEEPQNGEEEEENTAMPEEEGVAG